MRIFLLFYLISFLIPISYQDVERIARDDMLDIGLGWDSNSIDKTQLSAASSHNNFKAIGLISRTPNLDVQLFDTGTDSWSMTNMHDNGATTLSPYLHIKSKKFEYLDLELFIRATNNDQGMIGYSGIERDISRFGLNSAEVDISTLGLSNSWGSISYGRKRNVWGSSFQDNIVLSGLSPSYERISMTLDMERIRFSHFYAFLESVLDIESQENDVRYLSGKFIEYSNRRNFVLSAGEIVTLYGRNRGIDFSYINPISFHLELENNGRTSVTGGNTENAIWFIYADAFIMNRFRVSIEAIVDEFQFDQEDREQGRGDALGTRVHLSWFKDFDLYKFAVNADYISIGTYTYQHQNGLTNMVSRNHFLGYSLGNDLHKTSLTAKFIRSRHTLHFIFSHLRIGANNLHDNYYRAYELFSDIEFPSSPVSKENILSARYLSLGKKYYNYMIDAQYFISQDFSNYASIRMTVNFYIK